jgi:hypothetical protein
MSIHYTFNEETVSFVGFVHFTDFYRSVGIVIIARSHIRQKKVVVSTLALLHGCEESSSGRFFGFIDKI